jgi:hypothetical protein
MSAPGWQAVGEAAVGHAEHRTRGCARPIRLKGRTTRADARTGAVVSSYGSDDELDGITYRRCQDRRAAVCPSCSHEYKGDAWHLLACGLAGGKDVPESVADHPATFATLTAPSFGAVHGLRQSGPCRARRDRPVCEHGRQLFCTRRHAPGDPMLGQPLCADCYDYEGHVLWQFWAPELWRRFTIALQRRIAAMAGLTPAALRDHCRVAYAKVVEFQARGVIHVHVPIRLDGPDGPSTEARVDLDADDLGRAILDAAASVRRVVHGFAGRPDVALRWGAQLDVRPITGTANRDGRTGPAHPEQVAAYLAKYLTKACEDFGLPRRVPTARHAAAAGASPHAVRIVETAERLAAEGGPEYARLGACLATLGYRGHPVTKSHRFSVTFTRLRRARAEHHRKRPGLDPEAEVRELLDADPEDQADVVEVREWTYAGRGYLDTDTAANAVRSACLARSRRAARGVLA